MSSVLPTLVERTSHGTYEIDLYSKMLSERIVFLGAPVDDVVVADVTAQLLYLDHAAPERDIALYLNSPGGSLTAMLALYDTLRQLHADVETTCLGQAGPAAAVLLAAGTSGKRRMLPHARAVLRQPAVEGTHGTASDLEIQAGEILRGREVMRRVLAEHTGRDAGRVAADLDRETVLTAAESVAYGLVDAVVAERGRPGRPDWARRRSA